MRGSSSSQMLGGVDPFQDSRCGVPLRLWADQLNFGTQFLDSIPSFPFWFFLKPWAPKTALLVVVQINELLQRLVGIVPGIVIQEIAHNLPQNQDLWYLAFFSFSKYPAFSIKSDILHYLYYNERIVFGKLVVSNSPSAFSSIYIFMDEVDFLTFSTRQPIP